MDMLIKCKKDWDGYRVLAFTRGEYYSIEQIRLGASTNIGFQISNPDYADVWFWSGSEYFEIPFIQ